MVKALPPLGIFTLILSLLTSYTLADEVKPAPHALVKAPTEPAKKKPTKPAPTPLFDSEKESFIAEGDFLYWNLAGQGQVNYALQTEQVSDTFSRQSYAATTSFYNPGMRFKLGYYRATNFWDMTADYTLIHFEGHGKQQASSNRSLVSLFTDNTNTLLSSRCDTLTSYKNVNIMASRIFLPGANPYLRLRLEGGAGFAWMRQTSRINNTYEAGISESLINHWRYWGGGIRGALSFDWYLGDNIYVTGRFSPALVCGKLHQDNRIENSVEKKQTTTTSFHERDYRLSFNTQFVLGPSYQQNWSQGRFEVFIGYEMQMWTNLNPIAPPQLPLNNNAPITNDLFAMQGLSSRVTLYF